MQSPLSLHSAESMVGMFANNSGGYVKAFTVGNAPTFIISSSKKPHCDVQQRWASRKAHAPVLALALHALRAQAQAPCAVDGVIRVHHDRVRGPLAVRLNRQQCASDTRTISFI